MPIKMSCPECDKEYNLADTMEGDERDPEVQPSATRMASKPMRRNRKKRPTVGVAPEISGKTNFTECFLLTN